MFTAKKLKNRGQKLLNKKQEPIDKNNRTILSRIIMAKLAMNPIK
jgi:hypothetical protein